MFHIIDNHPAARHTLEQLIECQGKQCLSFDSTEAYLDYIKNPDRVVPRAILADYATILSVHVFQFIERIQLLQPDQQIILLTSIGCDDWDRIGKTGLCQMLKKPFQPQALWSLMSA